MIPEMRINVTTATGRHSFDYDIGAGWVTCTVSDFDWPSAIILNSGSGGGVHNDCEEAIEASSGVGFTFTYNDSGTARGKFTWAQNAGTFKIRANGTDVLLDMMGFTSPSAVAAASIEADLPCPYVFTPHRNLRDSDTFAWGRGASWERRQALAIQGISASGRTTTLAGTASWGVRPVTFTCLPDADMDWLAAFWDIARDGREIRFYQDRTVLSAYDRETNPWGYFDCTFDEDTCKEFKYKKTYPSTPGKFDVAFTLREVP